jgi:Bacterial Ig domain
MVLGCSKKDQSDHEAPVIQMISPTTNQVFQAGDSVHIRASISDNTEIHEVHLYVTNSANGALILHFEEHLDAATYTLDKAFAAQTGVTYKIEIDANDHSGNAAQQIVQVSGE